MSKLFDVDGDSSNVKYCQFDNKLCSFSSCDFLDSQGNVRICRRHKNHGGFHLRRSLASPVVPVFNKHLRLFVFLCSLSVESVLGVGLVQLRGNGVN